MPQTGNSGRFKKIIMSDAFEMERGYYMILLDIYVTICYNYDLCICGVVCVDGKLY